MRTFHFGALALTSGVLALSLFSTGKAVVRLIQPWEPMSGAGEIGRSVRGVIVVSAASDREVDLGTLDHTLLLVFDAECGACDANLANWINLLAETGGDGVGVIALGMGDTVALREYWDSFNGRIPVFWTDSASMSATGFRGTPTTALVREGRIAAEYVGVLNAREQEQLVAAVRGAKGT